MKGTFVVVLWISLGSMHHKIAPATATRVPQAFVVLPSRVPQETCIRNWLQGLKPPLQVAEVEVVVELNIFRQGPNESAV